MIFVKYVHCTGPDVVKFLEFAWTLQKVVVDQETTKYEKKF